MTEEVKLLGVDLSFASEIVIEILLDDPPDPSIFREILYANLKRTEILALLARHPATPEDVRSEARKGFLPVKAEGVPAVKASPAQTDDERQQSLLQRIQSLTVGEKIALALKGGRDVRSILAKDTNKEVVLNVLKNPKVTDSEAEMLAHSRNIPEDALRSIAKNREWMKSYNVVVALVNNPKTPAGIATPLVTGLKTKDLVALERNKNVSEAVRAVAKKLLQARKPH